MKLIRELLFCYIWRAFTNSSEVKYNVQRKLLFFFSLLIARDRCFLWSRDKYIYCLTCSYLAWPLTKYKRSIILSCQMPSKMTRQKYCLSHSFEEDVNRVVTSDFVLPALLDTFLSHWRKRKWSFHHKVFVNFNYLSLGE